jgi:energy-coupling factor transport system permease protein
MLRSIPLGIYNPGSSLLHRLQARTKLLVIITLVVALVIANRREWHFAPYIVAFTLIVIALLLSGTGFRNLWRRIWLLLGITFTSALFSIFAAEQGSRVLLQFGPLLPTYGQIYRLALIVSGCCLIVQIISRLPVACLQFLGHKLIFKILRVITLLLLVVALLVLWLGAGTPEQQTLIVGPLQVTQRGVWVFVSVFSMFVTLYLSSLLLTLTTMPVALIEGLTLLLKPLRRLKLPVDDFALMTLLGFRFIPTLIEEAGQLMKAQMARGGDVLHGTLTERLQSLVMFFQPLLQGSLRRASELATALEARGYQSEGQRTLLHETHLGRIDYLVLFIVLVSMTASLIF